MRLRRPRVPGVPLSEYGSSSSVSAPPTLNSVPNLRLRPGRLRDSDVASTSSTRRARGPCADAARSCSVSARSESTARPVKIAPGRTRLSDGPRLTGSATATNTIGSSRFQPPPDLPGWSATTTDGDLKVERPLHQKSCKRSYASAQSALVRNGNAPRHRVGHANTHFDETRLVRQERIVPIPQPPISRIRGMQNHSGPEDRASSSSKHSRSCY